MTPSAELTILRFLAGRTHASAAEIGAACWMNAAEVRARLDSLESRRLVASRQDKTVVPPRRVYYVTAEGKREVGWVFAGFIGSDSPVSHKSTTDAFH